MKNPSVQGPISIDKLIMSTKQVLHSGVVRSNPSNTKTGEGGGVIKSVRINGVRGLN